MMKTKLLLSFFVLMALTSCKNPTTSGDLVVQVGPENVQILPLSLKSCEDSAKGESEGSLGKAAAHFTLFKFAWKGTRDFYAQYIILEVQSNFLEGDGKFSQFITSDELGLAMKGKAFIAGGDNAVVQSSCGLRFGGMAFRQPGRAAFLSGTITVYGFEVDSDGNSTPVYSEAQVNMQYDGDPAED